MLHSGLKGLGVQVNQVNTNLFTVMYANVEVSALFYSEA